MFFTFCSTQTFLYLLEFIFAFSTSKFMSFLNVFFIFHFLQKLAIFPLFRKFFTFHLLRKLHIFQLFENFSFCSQFSHTSPHIIFSIFSRNLIFHIFASKFHFSFLKSPQITQNSNTTHRLILLLQKTLATRHKFQFRRSRRLQKAVAHLLNSSRRISPTR
jgi:hypothetical protein